MTWPLLNCCQTCQLDPSQNILLSKNPHRDRLIDLSSRPPAWWFVLVPEIGHFPVSKQYCKAFSTLSGMGHTPVLLSILSYVTPSASHMAQRISTFSCCYPTCTLDVNSLNKLRVMLELSTSSYSFYSWENLHNNWWASQETKGMGIHGENLELAIYLHVERGNPYARYMWIRAWVLRGHPGNAS